MPGSIVACAADVGAPAGAQAVLGAAHRAGDFAILVNGRQLMRGRPGTTHRIPSTKLRIRRCASSAIVLVNGLSQCWLQSLPTA